MPLDLTIHPTSQYLDMYGEPDGNSGYSISGVVTLSVTSTKTLFESTPRTARMLLQSLTVTFEGQSEIYTPNTGYSALRLCSITRELAPAETIELSNEGHEDDDKPCQWDVVFNLPISGWLPASTELGIEDIGIRYGLYAVAKFVNLEPESSGAFSMLSLCTPFRSRVRYRESRFPIYLRRFVSPPQLDPTEQKFINYLVNSKSSSQEQMNKSRIPSEILSKIQVLTTIPEVVDIEEGAFPLTIRLRTKGLDEEHCKRLQPTEIGIDIIQQERTRYRPSTNFLAQYPLPPLEMQPPNLPLRDPHPLNNVYDAGLYVSRDHTESVCRTFTLLPQGESGKYKLANDNYAFAMDAQQSNNPTWFTMETKIPFAHVSRAKLDAETAEWAGPAIMRPSTSSPLFGVSHDLSLSLTFTYDDPSLPNGRSRERLNFKIPISFGFYLPPLSTSLSLDDEASLLPSPASLPPYSQLYDENGEQRVDYSTPLPRYSPKDEEVDPAATTADSESLVESASSLSVGHKYEPELPVGEDEPLLPL